MLGLVGGAFLQAGAEAALVARRRPSSLWRRLLRAVAYAFYVSLLFGVLFGGLSLSCIPLFPLDTVFTMGPGVPLTLLGYAVTSWARGKWQRRGNGSNPSPVAAPSPSDNRP